MYRVLERFVSGQKWLDTLGDPLQQLVTSFFADRGTTGKQVKNVLNGTWLAHPLHPVLTDVPVGAWTATCVLDAVTVVSDDDSLERAADITLATGLGAALASAITGLTDWSDTYGEERRVGLLHGLTMIATTALYASSLVARLRGSRGRGMMLSATAYGLLSAGAYLGGDEVYDLGYPVNHTAFLHGPADYVPVMPEVDLPANQPTKAEASGVPIMLVKQGTQIYALDDTCVHAGCSLSGGTLDGTSIVCPCHGSQYDLRDGSVLNGPATMPEPHYDVRVQNGTIEVKQAPIR